MTGLQTTGASAPRVIWFTDPDGDLNFARLFADGHYWAANKWRGYRLCGVHCRRAGAALVAGTTSIRIRLVAPPSEAAA